MYGRHVPQMLTVMQIIDIPRLTERLECMLYRQRLELDISELLPDLNTLRDASQELRSCTKFKLILQAVLAVGNALNGSSFRGGARGFRLEALMKVRDLPPPYRPRGS